jgi:hypothetical protein
MCDCIVFKLFEQVPVEGSAVTPLSPTVYYTHWILLTSAGRRVEEVEVALQTGHLTVQCEFPFRVQLVTTNPTHLLVMVYVEAPTDTASGKPFHFQVAFFTLPFVETLQRVVNEAQLFLEG